ncbi:MAG: hypothetical protein RI922_2353 [Bacteroidota bacterium]
MKSEISHIVPKYSKEEIESFNQEFDFMDGDVELLKQTINILYLVIEDLYYFEGMPIKLNRDDAVIAGNLVRIVKLSTSFLENVCNHKLEICSIINRCLAETYINLRYILEEDETNSSRNFIKKSLIQEKELWESILDNIKSRNGEILPIEERMQNSIKISFDDSDFDLEEVQRSHKWKSIKNRAAILGSDQFYSIYYGISSHSVHGNWQDILMNNLERSEDGFKINLEWRMPRPQIVDGPIALNLSLIKSVTENLYERPTTFSMNVKNKTDELMQYQNELSSYHEKWLLKKRGR